MPDKHCPLCQAKAEIIVWQDTFCRVIVVEEINVPVFCRVIWQAHCAEMTDLTAAERQHLMDVVWAVEAGLRKIVQPTKINLASLGNVVPHLHWHVIARFTEDAHFPAPIWAAAQHSHTVLAVPNDWQTLLKHYLAEFV
jgi:diadenosine tetraphosphate (Ap4A) HIT family hydrolase